MARSSIMGLMLGRINTTPAVGFTTRWTVAGDATARTITLPLAATRTEGALAYDCTVNWGDGSALSTVTAYNDADRAHTYAADGTYNVEIRGTCEGWSFNNTGDRTKIVSVVNWGEAAAFNGFKYLNQAFYGCSNLASMPSAAIPASGTGVLAQGFAGFARACTSLTSLHGSTFSLHPGAITFNSVLFDAGVTTLASDLIASNVNATIFNSAFRAIPAVTIPDGFLANNTAMQQAEYIFYACPNLASYGADLLRNNTALRFLTQMFGGCPKLQIRSDTFFRPGEEATRFNNISMDFTSIFSRTSFSGSQGSAPTLWECNFGESINLDVAPTTDWVAGDIITGQTSGATVEVVSRTSATAYKVKKHYGTFTLDEVVGVTGDANKLADQGATRPTFSGRPTATTAFSGAGNSAASLSNYTDIPASWR
jgi:hypothetical protein